MKNFPDHSQSDEFERRLRNYTEPPDELVWENIDAALRPQRTPVWFPWVDRATSVAVVLAFTFLIGGSLSGDDVRNWDVAQVEKSTIMHSEKETVQSTAHDKNFSNKNVIPEADFGDGNHHTKSFAVEKNGFATDIGSTDGIYTTSNIDDETSGTSVMNPALATIESNNGSSDSQLIDSLSANTLAVMPDSIAQVDTAVKSSTRIPKRGHKFYAAITPSLSFQRAIPVSDEIVVSDFFNSSILSAERFGFSIETGVQGHLSKRWEYYGGISFYNQNQTLRYAYQVNNQVDVKPDEDGYIVTPKSLQGSLNYEMTNLGLSAGVLYNLYGRAKALRHKVGAGLVYQHGILKTEGQYENSESSYVSYQIFYRNEVRVGKRWSVFVQPVFTQSFLVQEKSDAPFNVKPYRAGLGFGILYDF